MNNTTEIVLQKPIEVVTGGDGLWSNCVKLVKITKLSLTKYTYDGKTWGSLNAYFDPESWNVETDGLVYTDKLFLNDFVEELSERTSLLNGTAYFDLDYSERGMQGADFINFDVDDAFCKAWDKNLVDFSQK